MLPSVKFAEDKVHQITAVIIDKASLFNNEISSANVSRTKNDVLIAIVGWCYR